MKTVSICTAATFALFASPVVAQEVGNYSGPYIGGIIAADNIEIGDGDESVDDSSAAYGGIIGYDADLGGLVVGIEGEVMQSSVAFEASEVDLGVDARVAADWDYYVGGRAGFKLSDTVLVYAKAGYTMLNIEATVSDSTVQLTGDDDISGFRIGGGIELSEGTGLGIRLEYRYSDYGKFDNLEGSDTSRGQVALAALYKF